MTEQLIVPAQRRTIQLYGTREYFYLPFPKLIFALLPGPYPELTRQKLGAIFDDEPEMVYPVPSLNVYRWCACVTRSEIEPENVKRFANLFWTTPFGRDCGTNRFLWSDMLGGGKTLHKLSPEACLNIWRDLDEAAFAERLRNAVAKSSSSFGSYFRPYPLEKFLTERSSW